MRAGTTFQFYSLQIEFTGQFRLRFACWLRPHLGVLSRLFSFRFFPASLPNYAIKRDLRAYIRFKFHIGRVGPLFWLLDGLELFSRAFQISRLLFDFYFSSSTRQLTAACAGFASGVSSSAFQHPVVQARPEVLFISHHQASRLVFQQSRHRHYQPYASWPS